MYWNHNKSETEATFELGLSSSAVRNTIRRHFLFYDRKISGRTSFNDICIT